MNERGWKSRLDALKSADWRVVLRRGAADLAARLHVLRESLRASWEGRQSRRAGPETPRRFPFSLINRLPRDGAASPARSARLHSALPLVLIGALLGVIVVLVYIASCAFDIPIDGGIANKDALASAVLLDASNGAELGTRGTMRGDKLDADELPDNLKKAIVAIEDRRFYQHGALDLHGMARALVRDTLLGHAREGASTLTQQLARLMLLSPERTMKRKVQEALIAVWLEHQLTKQEILARYLDTAYFGAGAYGADAAARRYFGKAARDLTLPEAAMIAGLVRAPSQLAPHRNLDAAQARAKLVLKAMADTGAITQAQERDAIAHPATLKVLPEAPASAGYAADAAAGEVKALVGDSAVDLTAATTIDADIQAAAEKAVATHLAAEGEARHVSQAAVVAMGPDGAILAMVGGRDYQASTYNRATQAKRQAGSLFKLFVYLTALEQGATPDTIVVDQPVKIGDWEPHNFEDTYGGRMPLHLAFARSINTVAARLAQQVGIKAVIKTAHDLGVQSTLPDVPSLALGTAEVDLMEMTRAFATVASDQDKIEPYLVRRITAHDKVLFNRPPQYAEDSEPSAAKLAMRDLLADVVTEGTGRGARLPFATGGKTGTTQDFRDAWFIGSAPDITVGVWVGNDDNSPMSKVTGGELPTKIWRDVVIAAEKAMDRRKGRAKIASAPTRPKSVSREARVDAPPPDEVAGADAGSPPDGPPDAAPQGEGPPDAAASGGEVVGDAEVVDTSTLDVEGRQVRLLGIAPMAGRSARALARYLHHREVSCAPAGGLFRCMVDGNDLATTILVNGGASATGDAPPDLVAAQQEAQAERRGIWHRLR